jgi:hypothetical protein
MPDDASLSKIVGICGRMTLLYRDVLLLSLHEIRPRRRLRSFPLRGQFQPCVLLVIPKSPR